MYHLYGYAHAAIRVSRTYPSSLGVVARLMASYAFR